MWWAIKIVQTKCFFLNNLLCVKACNYWNYHLITLHSVDIINTRVQIYVFCNNKEKCWWPKSFIVDKAQFDVARNIFLNWGSTSICKYILQEYKYILASNKYATLIKTKLTKKSIDNGLKIQLLMKLLSTRKAKLYPSVWLSSNWKNKGCKPQKIKK